MIGCWCDQSLVEKIDRARGTRTRSQFCREAIAEKLRAVGVPVSEHEATPPDRAGKGGPKRTLYRVPRHDVSLNESPPSSGSRKRANKRKPASGSY